MKRIAIIGGGISGITAAYEFAKLARAGVPVEATLFESSPRLGGIVETVREGGFIIECGPDAWLTEKPWARDLAIELGLEHELLPSNDATRRTYILKDGALKPIPDGMSMMVPSDLSALDHSDLFSESAKQAYRNELSRAAELKATAPVTDESVASFVRRHFGAEVLETIAAPLLSGVLGGNVENLSVRAVMAPYVAMEREHGSLIAALQAKAAAGPRSKPALFTTLRSGVATLIERMVVNIPPAWLRVNTGNVIVRRNTAPTSSGNTWSIQLPNGEDTPHNRPPPEPNPHPIEHFDTIIFATPVDVTFNLLAPYDFNAATLLDMQASFAIVVAFALPDASRFPLPPGFGFLVPPNFASEAAPTNGIASLRNSPSSSLLLAATFADQKFDHRVPPGGRLIRAYFGGPAAESLHNCNNDELAAIARMELAHILGPLPDPQITVVRRWPRSLPQYAVGHLDRMAELEARLTQLPNLYLLGNAYRGVGLPDLIRDARTTAQKAIHSLNPTTQPAH